MLSLARNFGRQPGRLGPSSARLREELERQGLIVIEQRGLRKTNVYLFVWTEELDRLMNSVQEVSDDPDEGDKDGPPVPPQTGTMLPGKTGS